MIRFKLKLMSFRPLVMPLPHSQRCNVLHQGEYTHTHTYTYIHTHSHIHTYTTCTYAHLTVIMIPENPILFRSSIDDVELFLFTEGGIQLKCIPRFWGPTGRRSITKCRSLPSQDASYYLIMTIGNSS